MRVPEKKVAKIMVGLILGSSFSESNGFTVRRYLTRPKYLAQKFFAVFVGKKKSWKIQNIVEQIAVCYLNMA